jgi:hypothetical protein
MLTVARMSLREVLRRRGVLLLMVLLPLAFYLVRRDLPGQSIRFLALGIGWSVSTTALFGACAARPAEQRLRLTGMSTTALVAGRLLAVQSVGLLLAGGYFGVVAVDQHVRRLWAVGVMFAITVLVAAPVGALLAALVPRELEGALALLVVVSTQMLADPEGAIAPLLPFWSTRQLATYAIDATGSGDLITGLVHGALLCTVAAVLATALTATRLRVTSWPRPSADPDLSWPPTGPPRATWPPRLPGHPS